VKDFPKIGSVVKGVAPFWRDDGTKGIPWEGRVGKLYPGYYSEDAEGVPMRYLPFDAVGVKLSDPPEDWPYEFGAYAPELGDIILVEGETVERGFVTIHNAERCVLDS